MIWYQFGYSNYRPYIANFEYFSDISINVYRTPVLVDNVPRGTLDNPLKSWKVYSPSEGAGIKFTTFSGTNGGGSSFLYCNYQSNDPARAPIVPPYERMIGFDENPNCYVSNFGTGSTAVFANVISTSITAILNTTYSGEKTIIPTAVPLFGSSAYWGIPINFALKTKTGVINCIGIYFTDGIVNARYVADNSMQNYMLVNSAGANPDVLSLDFGNVPQNVPQTFADWAATAFTKIKTAEISLYSNNGKTKLLETGLISDVASIIISKMGDSGVMTVKYQDVNIENDVFTWKISNENSDFIGLSPVKSAVVPALSNGRETVFPVIKPLKLYEVYGKLQPIPEKFTINLYNMTTELSRVDKTNYMTPTISVSGTMRNATSILSPAFNIKISNQSDVMMSNYCYIPILKRYYFITDIVAVNNDIYQINLSCDVLMSFKNDILKQQAVIARQENDYNTDLDDPLLKTEKELTYTIQDVSGSELDTTTDDLVRCVFAVIGVTPPDVEA